MTQADRPLEDAVLSDARALWDYHRLSMPYETADVVLGLGSYDIAVASFAARLFLEGRARWLMFTGGVVARDDLLRTPWPGAEADVFRERALSLGVPADRILVERSATNTGENFRFSMAEMTRLGVACERLLVVTKPNMERRARATAACNVPDPVRVTVTSAPATFEEYCRSGFDAHAIISLMVGDLQRIDVYPRMGFQAHEVIPDNTRRAFERLIAAGYTEHLLPSSELA